MALTYDAREVENFENLDEHLRERIADLCWTLMVVGIRNVTEKNWKQVWRRIHFYERLLGCAWSTPRDDIEKDSENPPEFGLAKDGITALSPRVTPHPTTPEMIKAAIGYRTNVSEMSEAKFRNHMWDIYKRESNALLKKLD